MRQTRYSVELGPSRSTACVHNLTAMRIALKFQHRTPAWRELADEFGMSRAAAYRWIAAFKIAKGELA